MNINIVKLRKTAKIPTRGSLSAAGYDLYADIEYPVWLYPGETFKVGTGLSMALPEGYFGAIFARSGLATKKGLRPANCVGIVDSDYRGEIIVPIHNDGTVPGQKIKIDPGERIAQLILLPFIPMEFSEVDEIDKTNRGNFGFGSTGSF